MTTAAPEQTPPQIPPQAPVPRGTVPRVIPITLGGIVATAGAVLALAGGGVLALAGTDSSVDSGRQHIGSSTTALVSETAKISDTGTVSDVLGDSSVKASVSGDQAKPVFVGVGRTADVDRYLAGAPVDKVTDFDVDPFTLDRSTQPGNATPKAPASQRFWVAKGTNATMNWKVRDGSYRMVVMNADGSRGVSADASFRVKVPHLSTIALVALIGGVAMIGGGTATIVLFARRPSASVTPQPVVAAG